MICVDGMAIDVANAVMVRTHLQVAADSAAHAAIMAREKHTEAQAKALAIQIAQASLPPGKFGDTIRPEDIQFGRWDAANDRFIVGPGSNESVLVSTQRLQSRDTAMVSYFLKFVGMLNMPAVKNTLSPSTNLDNSVWRPGEIHEFLCNTGGGGGGNGGGNGGGGGNNTVRIPANTTLVNGVIHTNCLLSIGSGVTLEDVLIISTNPSVAAIDGASGIVLGRNDNCSAGGGVQIVTMGGVNFPAQLHVYGSQIVAMGDIDFEANANGIQGVSMVAGGQIDSTSNMDMGFCAGAGLENRFEAEYFRMAR